MFSGILLGRAVHLSCSSFLRRVFPRVKVMAANLGSSLSLSSSCRETAVSSRGPNLEEPTQPESVSPSSSHPEEAPESSWATLVCFRFCTATRPYLTIYLTMESLSARIFSLPSRVRTAFSSFRHRFLVRLRWNPRKEERGDQYASRRANERQSGTSVTSPWPTLLGGRECFSAALRLRV